MRIRHANGFTLVELLVTVVIIGIVATLAIPGLLRARMSGNEASAIGSLRAIHSAESTFSSSCGEGNYAATLAGLGTPPTGGGEAFISPDIATAASGASVNKSGFTISLGAGGTAIVAGVLSCNGGLAVNSGYGTNADPISASTGERYFASDNHGAIFVSSTGTIAQPIPPAAIPLH